MSSPCRRFLRWGVFALYLGVIYATLPVMRGIQKALTGRFGDAVYLPVYLALLGAALLLCWRLVRRIHRSGPGPIGALLVLAAGYGLGIWMLPVLAERVHFVEYGLLALLAVWALATRGRSRGIYPAAVLITYLAGVGDETIQWLLPNRVGEWRDLVLNGASGLLAIWGLAMVWRPEGLDAPVSHRDRRLLAWLTLAAVAVTGLFLLGVHEYGWLLEEEGCQTRSNLRPEQVRGITPEIYRSEPGTNPVVDAFAQEARDHHGMSRWYLEQEMPRKAAGEVHLLETVYAVARAEEGWTWSEEEQGRMKPHRPDRDAPYLSRYRDELLVRFRPWQVVLVWVLALVAAGIPAVRLRCRPR